MEEGRILEVMQDFFRQRGKDLGLLPGRKVSECLPGSLETVEFLIHVEESLGLKDGAIDFNALGPRFADRTFADVAREIRAFVVGQPST
jgi:hypothetical protein